MSLAAADLLKQLIRFDTSNPPGREAGCVGFLRELLAKHGIESRLFALDPERPNLLARVRGRGDAPPLLLYGHLDVVPVTGQRWSVDPFAAVDHDGFIWGRGAIDMKGGVAMMVAAFVRSAAAAAEGSPPPGDLLLCLLSDEEVGGVNGARFMVERHAGEFGGVRHAIGEFGGFTLHMGGRRLYPVMVAEKQGCRVTVTLRGPSGHGSLPMRNGAMAALGRLLVTLDRRRLPVRVTAPVSVMVEAMARALPAPSSVVLRRLLNPAVTDRLLDGLGMQGRMLDALLHNTVNPTIVQSGSSGNVIPAEVEVQLDGRILPGLRPHHLVEELRRLIGRAPEILVDHYDEGADTIDLSAFDTFARVLREADPGGHPVPFVLPAVTDGRIFSRLGIQSYGFTPMRLPEGFDFSSLVHAADERIPTDEVGWGADRIFEAIRTYALT